MAEQEAPTWSEELQAGYDYVLQEEPDISNEDLAIILEVPVDILPSRNLEVQENVEVPVQENVEEESTLLENVSDVGQGILAGATDAINAATDLVIGRENREALDRGVGEFIGRENYIPIPENTITEITSDVTQSVIGLLPGIKFVKALGGIKGLGLFRNKYIAGTVGGAVGEFATGDEGLAEEVLELFKIIPREYGAETALAFSETIEEWMTEPEGDINNLKARLVTAAPGVVLGPVFEGIVDLAGKAFKAGGKASGDFMQMANGALRGDINPRRFFKTELDEATEEILEGVGQASRSSKKTNYKSLYARWLDRGQPLGKLVKHLASGRDIPAHVDPYKLWRTNIVANSKAKTFLEFGAVDFISRKRIGPSLQEILKPLNGQFKEFEAYAIAKRTIELEERGIVSGFDVETAKDIVSKYAEDSPFAESFRSLVNYQNQLTRYLMDSGVISEELYHKMLLKNKDYVPFYRIMDDETVGVAGKGSKKPIRSIKGLQTDEFGDVIERQIVSPLESIIADTHKYLEMAEKNRVAQALVKLGGGTKFLKEVKPTTKPMKVAVDEIPLNIRKEEYQSIRPRRIEPGLYKYRNYSISKLAKEEGKGWSLIAPGETESLKTFATKKEAYDYIESLPTEEIIDDAVQIQDVLRGGNQQNPEFTIFRKTDPREGQDTFTVFKDGKPHIYQASDPMVAHIINNFTPQEVNGIVKILNVPTRVLRAGAILDPAFFVKNMIRDNITAAVYSKSGFKPFLSWFDGMVSLAKKDSHYWAWVNNGGARATFVDLDRKYNQKNLQELVNETGLFKRVANVVNPLNLLEMLRVGSDVAENATRLGEFKLAVKQVGDDPEGLTEAAYRSREITLDFQRMGTDMRALNMIAAFANARVQGWDRLAREFIENPKQATAKAGLFITTPTVGFWFHNHSTPERAERYKNLPQWQKDLFWIVQVDDVVYRIPKPFEIGIIFGTYTEHIMNFAYGESELSLEQMWKSFGQPLWSDTGSAILPTGAVPFIENLANYDVFRASPLIPRSQENLLSVDQQRIYTTETAKALARAFDEIGITGRAVSPIGIENMTGDVFGTLGRRALNLTDRLLRETGVLPDPQIPTRTLSENFFTDSFTIPYPSLSLEPIQNFYTNLSEARKLLGSFKKRIDRLDPEGAIELADGRDFMKAKTYTGFEGGMRDLRKAIENILAAPNMTKEEKALKKDEIIMKMLEGATSLEKHLEQLVEEEEAQKKDVKSIKNKKGNKRKKEIFNLSE